MNTSFSQVKKMPPFETVIHYLSRLKNLHHNQLCEAMRLHGKGELDAFKREQVLSLSSAQRLFLRSPQYPDYYCVDAASMAPNPFVVKAFWIVLDFVRNNVQLEVMGINELNGIDFVDILSRTLIRIVPVPAGNITTLMRARAIHQNEVTYIYMIDKSDQMNEIQPITSSDSAAIVSNLRQARIWDVRYLLFGEANETEDD